MPLRDLDEMRSFKSEERALLARREMASRQEGVDSWIALALIDACLESVRAEHAAYRAKPWVSEGLFDYADMGFEESE